MSFKKMPDKVVFCGTTVPRRGYRFEHTLPGGVQLLIETLPEIDSWEGSVACGSFYHTEDGLDPQVLAGDLETRYESTWRAMATGAGYEVVERLPAVSLSSAQAMNN